MRRETGFFQGICLCRKGFAAHRRNAFARSLCASIDAFRTASHPFISFIYALKTGL